MLICMIQSQRQQIKKYDVAPQLARLTLFHGTKHKSWDESVQSPTHHMHSFSENMVRSMFRQNKSKKWAVYNQRCVLDVVNGIWCCT
jgi:hypothetical protein